MSEENSSVSDLEQEFINEQKGEGALTVRVGRDGEYDYLGYDINLEDVEALYFEGIGVPRWESLQSGGTVEEQTALYWERFNALMDELPMIGRMRDTDERVEYGTDETRSLLEECDRVLAGATNPKAVRALKKIRLAAEKAVENQAGLRLSPSQIPIF